MLFDFTRQLSLLDPFSAKLKSNVVIASIGEVTSRALEEEGLVPRILPTQPKMGALAQAVAEYFDRKTKGT